MSEKTNSTTSKKQINFNLNLKNVEIDDILHLHPLQARVLDHLFFCLNKKQINKPLIPSRARSGVNKIQILKGYGDIK